jgi:MutS domain V
MHDLDVDALMSALPTYTQEGSKALRHRLSTPITDVAEIHERQQEIRAVRKQIKTASLLNKGGKEIQAIRKRLAENEPIVASIASTPDDSRHTEYYSQILWDSKNAWFRWLNEVNWIQELIVIGRTLVLPGMAMLMPFILLVMPIMVLTANKGTAWTAQDYLELLSDAVSKAMPTAGIKARFKGAGGIMEAGEQCVHVAIAIGMFIASIWSQVSSAIAMRSVVTDMRTRAQALEQFLKDANTLSIYTDPANLSVPVLVCEIAKSQGELARFGRGWNNPALLQSLLKEVGRMDMLAAIALAKNSCFPTQDSKQGLVLRSFYHPGVATNQRVYNTLLLGTDKPHAILTGPNRGGKSTVLKAIGTAVLMAHTVGIVFAREANIPMFDHIVTAMEPRDHLGKLSLFESEIEFAKNVRALKGRVFLLMDEIFHGTNAHDGTEASQVFMDGLYTRESNVTSIISTHYMELPEHFKKQVQTICMESSQDTGDETLRYTYKLRPGVNRVSSVREILRERGLLVRPSTE